MIPQREENEFRTKQHEIPVEKVRSMAEETELRAGDDSVQRVDRTRLEACKQALQERWLRDGNELLTAAGVPIWVDVEGVPGNSLPHRLQWYLSRRKDVAEHEKAGVCKTLNALEASLRPNDRTHLPRKAN